MSQKVTVSLPRLEVSGGAEKRKEIYVAGVVVQESDWRDQVDGGSEFMADFEQACAERGIQLCVLPPRSPQLNGRVERLQATFRHEFYGSYTLPHRIEPLNRCLDDFNHLYNRLSAPPGAR